MFTNLFKVNKLKFNQLYIYLLIMMVNITSGLWFTKSTWYYKWEVGSFVHKLTHISFLQPVQLPQLADRKNPVLGPFA